MKNKNFAAVVSILLLMNGCSSADDLVVTPVNEMELITTLQVNFIPQSGGENVALQYQDLDGEGGIPPKITVSKSFEQSKTYNGTIILRNELVNPPIDVTTEIISEAVEHQFFYQTTGNLPQFQYANVPSNFDSNGKPFGIQSVFRTTTAAAGILQISLRHGPNKNGANVSNGIITNAGGATDIEVRLNIAVQ